MAAGNLNKITVTESDIAGALLKGNTISQLTIPELKKMAFLQERSEINRTERSVVERYEGLRDAFIEYHLK